MLKLNPDTEVAWQPLATKIRQVTSIAPDAFALAAYDALFVAYRFLQQSRGGKNFSLLKVKFVAIANAYTGVTGPTTLNQDGDHVFSDFDFWAFRRVNDVLSWVVIGRYIDGTLYLY